VNIKQTRNQQAETPCSACFCYSTLRMIETPSSEMNFDFQQTTLHYIAEDRTLHKHCCENISSYKYGSSYFMSISENSKQFYSHRSYLKLCECSHRASFSLGLRFDPENRGKNSYETFTFNRLHSVTFQKMKHFIIISERRK
jgi:hypothetical protein